MQLSLMVLSSLLLAAAAPARPAPATITLRNCDVFLLNNGQARVPAKEAGVLMKFAVVEGQQVKSGELLAQIDDADAKLAAKAAKAKFDAANEEAISTVNIRYARAAALVAQAEYDQGLAANKSVANTTPLAELRRLRLTAERGLLEIEKNDCDQRIAVLKAKVAEAEAEKADEDVKRRQVRSPLDGEVVDLYCHAGEWVKPGDPVVRVVRMDRLQIGGSLLAADVEPGEIDNRRVSVLVQLARGRQENFSGKIVFVSPLIVAGKEFRVLAEVDNRQQDGHWLLRDGHMAEMTIQLK